MICEICGLPMEASTPGSKAPDSAMEVTLRIHLGIDPWGVSRGWEVRTVTVHRRHRWVDEAAPGVRYASPATPGTHADLRSAHTPTDDDPAWCPACNNQWPCETSLLLNDFDRLAAERPRSGTEPYETRVKRSRTDRELFDLVQASAKGTLPQGFEV